MITKVKDLSKVILNNQDVLIRAKLMKKSTIIMPDGISDADKAGAGEEWKMDIIAVGNEVKAFSAGDIVVSTKTNRVEFHRIDNNNPDSDRYFVLHMNNIEFVVKAENYEE